MKSGWIIQKPASRTLKGYLKLFSILCSWKYASRLSYFGRVYQQRKDCVSETIRRTLERIEECSRWIERKVPWFVAGETLYETV